MRLKIKTTTGKITKATLDAIAETQRIDGEIKILQERSKGLKTRIKEGFEAEKLTKIQGDTFSVTYVGGSTKVSLDTKTFKKEHLDMFKKYAKTSDSASFIKVSVSK